MIKNLMDRYLFVILTISLTTYFQIILKWQIMKLSFHPTQSVLSKFLFLAKSASTNIFIISAFVASAFGSLCWMLALRKNALSSIFPMLSLSFILVTVISSFLFKERVGYYQIAGIILITVGVILMGHESYTYSNI